jgi:hypothetical protein
MPHVSRVDRVSVSEEVMPVLPTLREARYSQSLERGLAILACFTAERLLLGISEIADQLGMSRSTTHRYVTTLVALGFLEQGVERKYRLGLGVTDIGMSALNSMGLREHSHPLLEELRERSGHAVSLAVLERAEILYVDDAHLKDLHDEGVSGPIRACPQPSTNPAVSRQIRASPSADQAVSGGLQRFRVAHIASRVLGRIPLNHAESNLTEPRTRKHARSTQIAVDRVSRPVQPLCHPFHAVHEG